MSEFALHPRLAADTVFVADWALSRVLLMDDGRFPWLVLVPRQSGAVEIFDLEDDSRTMLMQEIARAARALKAVTGCDKINIAALGNQVAQLHVHVVARNRDDAAWPGPVWGHGRAVRRDADALKRLIGALRHEFQRPIDP